ncbi:hypothetical protein GGR51DRAFT_523424 [Nemania sp. FL0031]|nr:hypothetical protein GGR51DRAFT_523424 [Nemania sp. FL0031]
MRFIPSFLSIPPRNLAAFFISTSAPAYSNMDRQYITSRDRDYIVYHTTIKAALCKHISSHAISRRPMRIHLVGSYPSLPTCLRLFVLTTIVSRSYP